MTQKHDPIVVYGAYGYTGQLIVEELVRRGMRPIVAGRNEARTYALAETYNLPGRVADLTQPERVDALLQDTSVVLHCAGPFRFTARDMAEACLRRRCHYIDITGEIPVFEELAALDAKARDAGIMLLPGAGFDVVPSDCLAAFLKQALPTAERLLLAYCGLGNFSHGTLKTIVGELWRGGAVRRGGKIVPVPHAFRTRKIDFGDGKLRTCVTIPWGDVATAYYSTEIPNIEVYMAAPSSLRRLLYLCRFAKPLLRNKAFIRWMQSRIPEGGPSAEERARGYALFYGEVTDKFGRIKRARLRTPEGYTLTALTAVAIAQRALRGEVRTGFVTPSLAYGADFILEIPGCTRSTVE